MKQITRKVKALFNLLSLGVQRSIIIASIVLILLLLPLGADIMKDALGMILFTLFWTAVFWCCIISACWIYDGFKHPKQKEKTQTHKVIFESLQILHNHIDKIEADLSESKKSTATKLKELGEEQTTLNAEIEDLNERLLLLRPVVERLIKMHIRREIKDALNNNINRQ